MSCRGALADSCPLAYRSCPSPVPELTSDGSKPVNALTHTHTHGHTPTHGFFSVCVSRPKGAKKPVCPGRRGGKGEKGKEGGGKEKRGRFANVFGDAATCGSVDCV